MNIIKKFIATILTILTAGSVLTGMSFAEGQYTDVSAQGSYVNTEYYASDETNYEQMEQAANDEQIDLQADIVDSGTCGDDLEWTLDSEGLLTITGKYEMENYSSYSTRWNGNSSKIKKIYINITKQGTIGNYAFYGCTNLTEVEIAGDVRSIGDQAFYNCSSMQTLTFNDNINSIGSSAFYNCSNMQDICYLGTIEDWLKIKGKSDYLSYYARHVYFGDDKHEAEETVTIPDSIELISSHRLDSTNGAFDNIKTVIIPKTVVELGQSSLPRECENIYYQGELADWLGITFGGKICSGSGNVYFNDKLVTEIIIPDKTEKILSGTFSFFNSIQKISLPNSIKEIGSNAFPTVSEGIYYSGDVNDWLEILFGSGWKEVSNDIFFNNKSVEEIEISASESGVPKDIPAYAFYGFKNLKKVTIKAGSQVENIKNNAFSQCPALSEITMESGSGVKNIENNAFDYCRSLKYIFIPDSVQTINYRRSSDQRDDYYYSPFWLTSSTQIFCESPEELKGWGKYWNYYDSGKKCKTFMGISFDDYELWKTLEKGKNITIPQGITRIPYGMFTSDTTIESIDMPDTVTEIDAKAFQGCNNLKDITLSNNLEKINENTFEYCQSLKELVIPDSVKNIGKLAFSNCKGLEKVYIPESVEEITADSWSYSPFYGCGSSIFLFVGANQETTENKWGAYWNNYNSRISYDVTIDEYKICDPNNTSITEVNLQGLTKIPAYAFYGCTNLKSINGIEKITSIGDYAFYGFAGTELEVPDSVEKIGQYSFNYSTKIREIVLGKNVKEIGAYAFSGLSKLNSVDFNNNDVVIDETAFQNSGTTNSNTDHKIDFTAPSLNSTAYDFYLQNEDTINFSYKYCAEGTHIWETKEGYDATCTETGRKSGRVCAVCGYDEREEIPALGHRYDDGVVTTEASCDKNGIKTFTCQNDPSHTYTEEIHALGHDWGNWTATGETQGEESRTCSRCNETEVRTVITDYHELVEVSASAPTCTEAGNNRHWKCTICERLFSDSDATAEIDVEDTIIAPVGHSPEEAVKENIVEATCTEDGSYDEVVYCSVCNNELSRNRVVESGHHKLEYVASNPATCLSEGYEEYWECSACHKLFKDAEGNTELLEIQKLEKTDHVYENALTPATLKADGYTIQKCKICGEEKGVKTAIKKIASVSLSKTKYTYNKKTQKPTVTVKNSAGKTLKNGTDYTVKYSNAKSKDAGKYTVKVIFKGNYSGTKTLNYTINKAIIKGKGLFTKYFTDKGRTFNLKTKITGKGKLIYKSSNKNIVTVNKKGAVKIVGSGTAKITVTQKGNKNYKNKKKIIVKVLPVKLSLVDGGSNVRQEVDMGYFKNGYYMIAYNGGKRMKQQSEDTVSDKLDIIAYYNFTWDASKRDGKFKKGDTVYIKVSENKKGKYITSNKVTIKK